MIPGPVEIDPLVQNSMSTAATSHIDPTFIETFGKAIELTRKVFLAPTGQPFILAGSGTLTWDMTAANLIEPGDKVLVVNTGIFGDWFAECIEVYGGKCTSLRAEFGDRPSFDAITEALKNEVKTGTPFKMITLTHVDTSTSVLVDVEKVSAIVKKESPNTLIAVDGVCSIGAEILRQEEWGVDVAMTASQKALGVPPGLAVMVVSQRALKVAAERKSPPAIYFGSFKKWLPIMAKYEARQVSYFATPPVQLIIALKTSLEQLLASPGGIEGRFKKHAEISEKVKSFVKDLGLKIVPVSNEVAAHSLTAIYFPKGFTAPQVLPKVVARGVVLAGGLHPKFAAEYFRVGHMNISACDDHLKHIDTTLNAIKDALTEAGYSKA
ncbi:hypothetical protein HK099_007169, partial [Clydaea vesicula]